MHFRSRRKFKFSVQVYAVYLYVGASVVMASSGVVTEKKKQKAAARAAACVLSNLKP